MCGCYSMQLHVSSCAIMYRKHMNMFIVIPFANEVEGGILVSLCSSVSLFVCPAYICPSNRPSVHEILSAPLSWWPGPVSCLLLGVSSGYAQPITRQVTSVTWLPTLTWSKLRLCLANHKAGYFSNLACDWLSIIWAYSEQETENGPWLCKEPGHQQPWYWPSSPRIFWHQQQYQLIPHAAMKHNVYWHNPWSDML